MNELEDHPFSQIFPLYEDGDLNELADSIDRNGQREDVVLFEGKILDGRNRFRACRLKSIAPKTRIFNPEKEGDPLKFVMDLNLHRRHLSASQRSTIGAKMIQEMERVAREAVGDNWGQGGFQKGAENPQAKVKATKAPPKPAETPAPAAGTAPETPEKNPGETPAELPHEKLMREAAEARANEGGQDGDGDLEIVTRTPEAGAEVTGDGTGTTLPEAGEGEGEKESVGKTEAREEVAKDLGVSVRSIKRAEAVAKADPEAFKQVADGKLSVNAAAEKVALAEQRKTHMKRILEVCGAEFAQAVERNTILKTAKEMRAFIALTDPDMVSIKHFVSIGWAVKKAMAHVVNVITADSTVADLINKTIASGGTGEFNIVINGYEIFVTKVIEAGAASTGAPAE